jgi:serpin B
MASDEPGMRLASGSNTFGFELWARVAAAAANHNLAMSPASMSIALAMTYGGAKAETAAQLARVLHFASEPGAVMTAWGGLARALTAPERPILLRIANRLFGDDAYTFEQPYLDQTRAAFGAPLEPIAFRSAPEPARARINRWVEDQTERRIEGLLPAGSINATTRLVLVNAIYFLGLWEQPFQPRRTRDAPFHTAASRVKQVPTMTQVGTFRYARLGGVTLVELPYKRGSASLLVALPDKRDGLAETERSLSNATFTSWRRALAAEEVSISLPRFEVAPGAPLALAKDLAALGMPVAFDRERADFTGIADPRDPAERLCISEVIHKAFVKVDEQGTEAAAATAVVMVGRAAPRRELIMLEVDHPFLWFIVDHDSGLVLFMGRVTEP